MSVEPYDFSEIERIRFGRFPLLDTVLYRWARRIEETLFDQFRLELYAGSSVVEEMKFSSFFASLKRPRPIYIFTMEPFQGQGLLVLDNRFSRLCINKSGADPVGRDDADPLGPENHRRLQQVVQRMMTDFDACWADVMKVRLQLQKITTYLFRARILNAYEPCLVAQIHLSGDQVSSRLTWCFPRSMLEPALSELSADKVIPSPYAPQVSTQAPQAARFLERAQYRLSVKMGTLDFRRAAHELAVGKVLPLTNEVGGEAVVEVNGAPLLVGTVGEVQGKFALKVTGTYAQRVEQFRRAEAPFREIEWPAVEAD